jgi:hypothetical protein
VYFRRRTSNGGLQFGFKDGGRVIVPVLLEFTGHTTQLFIVLFGARAHSELIFD